MSIRQRRPPAAAAYPTARVYAWPTLFRASQSLRTPAPLALTVVRHGQSVANARGLISGTTDYPLTDSGRRSARALDVSGVFDLAVASDLQRSQQTLTEILMAGRARAREAATDRRFRERSFGVLEGRRRFPIPEVAHGDLRYAPPHGESYLDLTRRCLSALLDLLRWSYGDGPGTARGRVLVSTHAGPMRVIAALASGERDPAAVTAAAFSNLHVEEVQLQTLPWPQFVSQSDIEWSRHSTTLIDARNGARSRNTIVIAAANGGRRSGTVTRR